MKTAFPLILEYMTSNIWAMEYNLLSRMTEIVERQIKGQHLSEDDMKTVVAAKTLKGSDKRSYEVTESGAAIIPVSGLIAKHSRMLNGSSQPRGTSVELLNKQLNAALSDRAVDRIILQIESPGGSINGVADFAESVYRASFEKPVTAYVDDLCASAAYWIGSQANAMYVNQTGLVGSIGVYTLMLDSSERAATEGLKFIIVRSGANKGVGAAGIEISDENIAVIAQEIDDSFQIFKSTVLRGRTEAGMAAELLDELADGRCFVGKAAVDNLLVDGIRTFGEILNEQAPMIRSENHGIAAVASAENVNVTSKETIMPKNENSKEKDAAVVTDDTKVAVESERARVLGISSILTGEEFADVRNTAINSGQTLTEAKAAAFDVAQECRATEKKDMQAKLDESNSRLAAIAKGGQADITAQGDPEDDKDNKATTADSGDAQAYVTAVRKCVETGKTEAEAMQIVGNKYPDNHQTWIANGCQPEI